MASQHYQPFHAYEAYERRPLDADTEARLKQVNTSSLAGVLSKKGYEGLFMPGIRRVAGSETMIGLALTLRLLPLRPDGAFSSSENERNPQRVAVEGVRPGDVLVIDARGNTFSGVLGDVLATRVTVLGGTGVVTDGGLRDIAQLESIGIPMYCAAAHGAASPSIHTYADVNLPVSCAGARVNPGDVIVGDADGVLVIPRHLVEEVAREAVEQESLETWVLERIKDGASTNNHYPPDETRLAEYRDWRASRSN